MSGSQGGPGELGLPASCIGRLALACRGGSGQSVTGGRTWEGEHLHSADVSGSCEPSQEMVEERGLWAAEERRELGASEHLMLCGSRLPPAPSPPASLAASPHHSPSLSVY